MLLKLPKIVSFLQFFADAIKEAVMPIYVYASERLRFVLLENGIGNCAMN